MSSTNFLIQNIAELFATKNIISGGNLSNASNMPNMHGKSVTLWYFLCLLIAILLKGLIVYLLYNFMVPKIIYSLSENKSLEIIESNFKTLTYSESVLLVILTNTLFYF